MRSAIAMREPWSRGRRSSWRVVPLALVSLVLASGSAVASDEPSADFDHTDTRFVLTGSHESVPCEGCHRMGVFRGTPTRCSFCHDGSGTRAESGKPIDHIPTSDRCEDCHTAVTWLQVRFDHVAVSGRCASCHDGSRAVGTPMGHITTTADCDACHNTILWSVVRFDHSNVMGVCSSCHNGMEATGKPNGHLQTSSECDLCHSTRAWTPTMFDHTGVMGTCSSCHDGIDATGTPNGHFLTMQECDVCHTTTRWVPDIFRHASPDYPGDHARDLACTACHPGNSEMVLYTDDPGLAPDCAGCHRNDFRPGPHKKHENPDTSYTVQELRDCTGSCHVYEDATLSRIKETRNGEHRVSDREF